LAKADMAARKEIILQQFETRASFFLRGARQTIVAESSNSAREDSTEWDLSKHFFGLLVFQSIMYSRSVVSDQQV
jgi:hypothetical protein